MHKWGLCLSPGSLRGSLPVVLWPHCSPLLATVSAKYQCGMYPGTARATWQWPGVFQESSHQGRKRASFSLHQKELDTDSEYHHLLHDPGQILKLWHLSFHIYHMEWRVLSAPQAVEKMVWNLSPGMYMESEFQSSPYLPLQFNIFILSTCLAREVIRPIRS